MPLVDLLAATQPAIALGARSIRLLDSPPVFYAGLLVRTASAPSPPLTSSRTSSVAPNDASFFRPSTLAPPSTSWSVSSLFCPRRSPGPASVPRHRAPPKRPSPCPPQPRLQPRHPARPRLARPRPSPPSTRPWPARPRLPLPQPEAQRPIVLRRPSPLQRGLGDLARKDIRRRRRRHHLRVSLPSPPSCSRSRPPSANLNRSYFTNRQDRYLHFTLQPMLADYCFSFLQLISSFSYNIVPSPSIDAPIIQWPDPSTQPCKIHSKVYNALTQFQAARLTSSRFTDDTVLFPVIQGGQFNIREEERVLSVLFNHLASQRASGAPTPALTWTSGYFGLHKPYQDMILKSPAACDVIAAGPKVVAYALPFLISFSSAPG